MEESRERVDFEYLIIYDGEIYCRIRGRKNDKPDGLVLITNQESRRPVNEIYTSSQFQNHLPLSDIYRDLLNCANKAFNGRHFSISLRMFGKNGH